jgi:hypothetical protein
LFRQDEQTWIAGWVDQIMSESDQWIPSWMEFLDLRRNGKAIMRDPNDRGYLYSSIFLARFALHHWIVVQTLQPDNRPTLAAELRKHPYETEMLGGEPFVVSHVNGVLAESGGPLTVSAPPAEQLIACAYCGSKYKQSEPRCAHCGARR